MHKYYTLAQILLILPILNPTLAVPVVVREIHNARDDLMVIAEDVAAMSNRRHGWEVASDRSKSSRSSTSSTPVPFTPSQHLSSSGESTSSLPWILDMLPSPQYSSDGGASPQHSSSSDGRVSVHDPPSLDGSLSSYHFTTLEDGSGPSHAPIPEGSMSTVLPPSHAPTPEGSRPPHDSTPERLMPSPPSPPPDNAKFFNKMMMKLKVVAGVVIVGAVIASIAGSQIAHHDHQDSRP